MRIKFASFALAFALLVGGGTAYAEEGGHSGWAHSADNQIGNLSSLQRGARNFTNYCTGCHSLKYERYSRLCDDL
jgi:ubiquinol-cytochrome c reductase cytochrome c1 subunit